MDNRKLGIMAPLMQSFTSIGPMLDIVALFSVISIFSGVYLPVVVFVAFLVGFSTLNTTYLLSRSYISNGGYYSYVGKTLGKTPGIFVGFLYLCYAILVLPDISLFLEGLLTLSEKKTEEPLPENATMPKMRPSHNAPKFNFSVLYT